MRTAIAAILFLAACGEPSMCQKDTDCKGDRVCSAGQCTEPGPVDMRPTRDGLYAPDGARIQCACHVYDDCLTAWPDGEPRTCASGQCLEYQYDDGGQHVPDGGKCIDPVN